MKLIPIREVIEGNRIVICEDSIVRGTQLKNFTVAKLWDCGARHPCPARLSTPDVPLLDSTCPPASTDELAARRAIRSLEGHDLADVSEYLDPTSEKYRRMVDWIAKDFGVTTLRYQTVEDMVEAIGLPKAEALPLLLDGPMPQVRVPKVADRHHRTRQGWPQENSGRHGPVRDVVNLRHRYVSPSFPRQLRIRNRERGGPGRRGHGKRAADAGQVDRSMPRDSAGEPGLRWKSNLGRVDEHAGRRSRIHVLALGLPVLPGVLFQPTNGPARRSRQ